MHFVEFTSGICSDECVGWASVDMQGWRCIHASALDHATCDGSVQIRWTFTREDSKPGKQRRFPKTGAMRRKLGVSWAVIRPWISQIELPVTSGT